MGAREPRLMPKVEIVATPPDGSAGERLTYKTGRGRVIAVFTSEYASVSEAEDAAKALEACRQPDDIALVLPHGYDLKVYLVPDDGGPASPDTTTPTPNSETAAKPNTTP